MNRTIFYINRGWISKSATECYRPIGQTTISTVISSTEKPALFSPTNQPQTKVLLWLENNSLIKACDMTQNSTYAIILEEIGKYIISTKQVNVINIL